MGDDESIFTEVLRTGEMADLGGKGQLGAKEQYLEFYKRADKVTKLLEFKANSMYYQQLESESERRQQHLARQNDVLHDYVCELEKEFEKIMGEIHSLEGKKGAMLAKLQGLLEPSAESRSSAMANH